MRLQLDADRDYQGQSLPHFQVILQNEDIQVIYPHALQDPPQDKVYLA